MIRPAGRRARWWLRASWLLPQGDGGGDCRPGRSSSPSCAARPRRRCRARAPRPPTSGRRRSRPARTSRRPGRSRRWGPGRRCRGGRRCGCGRRSGAGCDCRSASISSGSTLSWRLPNESVQRTSATTASSSMRVIGIIPGMRPLMSTSGPRSSRSTPLHRWAAAGTEDVAAGERGPGRAAAGSRGWSARPPGWPRPPWTRPGRAARCRDPTRIDGAVARPRRRWPGGRSPPRVDHGEDDAGGEVLGGAGQREAAGADVVRRHVVRDVDDPHLGSDLGGSPSGPRPRTRRWCRSRSGTRWCRSEPPFDPTA